MIEREFHVKTIQRLLKRYRVVGMIGARQVGKTTLAHMIADQWKEPTTFFDLESPEDQSRLTDPMLALKPLKGLVVLDEIQRLPEIFEVIRVLADRRRPATRFLILGSASPQLLSQSSETLAGCIVYSELPGFSLNEVGMDNHPRLWLRGGFPRAYLAPTHKQSGEWRRSFIQTFLERDLPQLGVTIRSMTMRRFWTMLAHYHGQIWNASEFARSFGVADTTIRNHLDLMTSALVIRQLPAWRENISKRQVKAPKIYIADSGLLHSLLNLRTHADLESHPKLGASWEGFVIHEIIQHLNVRADECYFWATHSGAELDLLVVRGKQRIGFEIKRTASPKATRSMTQALKDLRLQRLDLVHAGEHTFPISERIRSVAFSRILEDIPRLR